MSNMDRLAEDLALKSLARIEADGPRCDLPVREQRRTGLMGRILGRSSEPSSYDRRMELEASSDVDARVASLVSHRLLNAHRREIAAFVPEALFAGALPKDDEDRFMVIADAVLTIVHGHLHQDLPSRYDEEAEAIRLHALVDALDQESASSFAERLRSHLNDRLVGYGDDARLALEEALLIEIDNVMLGDVDDDGTMPYAMDVIFDGHPLATMASMGDGSLSVLSWLGGHGPDDLEAVRNYVLECGEPRSDVHGERPDTLEEMLLDRVTSLLTRYAFIESLSDAVLFCDVDPTAPSGQVIRVAPIDPDVGREETWLLVMDEYPEAIILDFLSEEDSFALWMAHSDSSPISAPSAA